MILSFVLRDSGFECAAWLWGPTARRVKPESLVGAGIAEAKSVEVAAVMAGSMAAISGWVGGLAVFSSVRRAALSAATRRAVLEHVAQTPLVVASM